MLTRFVNWVKQSSSIDGVLPKPGGRMLRGESKRAKILPSLRYRGGGTISSDQDAAEQFLLYMKDLYARLLSDMARYGAEWPDLEADEDPNGPGSEFSDFQFNWAVDRVHTGRAAGHNGIQVELYKYSKWARGLL